MTERFVIKVNIREAKMVRRILTKSRIAYKSGENGRFVLYDQDDYAVADMLLHNSLIDMKGV